MPKAAPSPCRHSGCRALVRDGSGYCQQHMRQVRQESDARRGTRTERGYSNRWLKARATYLRSHPLCLACQSGGVVKPATEVDHIIPHKGDQTLFWNSSNWQPLCKPCHSAKTARENGGFGNERKVYAWHKGRGGSDV